MPLLTGQDVGQTFGDRDLYSGLQFKLEARERIGLVGPNGVGKTALLDCIAGEVELRRGEISRREGLTIGYLRQEAVLPAGGRESTVFAAMMGVFATLTGLERAMRGLEDRMAAGETSAALIEDYGELQNRYDTGGGYLFRQRIRQVLEGLGFGEESWETPIAHLSGGQKTRLLLGRLLLEEPDLLVLDEPTNHLDSQAVEWLERTLREWPGALLMVSHDRYFLDRVATSIWELTARGLAVYRGNYSSFVRQRQAHFDREEKLFAGEKERLEKELDWIRRHIAGGKTDMAKGRLKRLTRDIVLIEAIGVVGKEGRAWSEVGGRVRTLTVNEAAERLAALQPPGNRPPRLNIRLKSEERSGQFVLRSKRLTIGHPDRPLFRTDKLYLERLDCAAVIGPNGSGKTTFLKSILGEVSLLRGSITLGENVRIGYFAQGHEQLNDSHRVIDELMTRIPIGEQEARNTLAAFQFQGHDVFKPVAALSGGERGRLALAVLALQQANFLLLDEPTNHLDIDAQEALQEVLERFDGTILLVSHDRYLIDRLATQIWHIDGDELRVFAGSYAAYRGWLEAGGDSLGPTLAAHGVKIEAAPPPAPGPVDISWVDDLVEAGGSPASKPRARGGRRRFEAERLEIYLATLYEELELARLAGDSDEIAFLEREISATEAELGAL